MNQLEIVQLNFRNNQKTIKQYLKCIERSCNILELEIPPVYFIYQDESNFFLFDQNLNYISSDYRDVGKNINFMKFIRNEYVIYVNCCAFADPTLIIIKAYELVRHIYQLKMISYFETMNKNIKAGQTSENNEDIRKLENSSTYQKLESNIRSWKYCYQNKNKNKVSNELNIKGNKNVSLIEADMMAFSYLMMKKYHRINIDYKIENKKDFRKSVDFVNETIFNFIT